MMAMMVVVVTKFNGDGDDEEVAIFEDSEMSPNVWREIKVESHQQASISWRRKRAGGWSINKMMMMMMRMMKMIDGDDVTVQGGVLSYFVASNKARWLNNIDFEEFFQYSPKP